MVTLTKQQLKDLIDGKIDKESTDTDTSEKSGYKHDSRDVFEGKFTLVC